MGVAASITAALTLASVAATATKFTTYDKNKKIEEEEQAAREEEEENYKKAQEEMMKEQAEQQRQAERQADLAIPREYIFG